MPASTTIEVVGVKQTINSLRKIDPQLQKDFKADATQIAQPAIQAGSSKGHSWTMSVHESTRNEMALVVCTRSSAHSSAPEHQKHSGLAVHSPQSAEANGRKMSTNHDV